MLCEIRYMKRGPGERQAERPRLAPCITRGTMLIIYITPDEGSW